MGDYVFDKSIFYFFQSFCTHCQGFANNPILLLFQLVITVTNISNYIIKQYYSIIKTLKGLVLSKRNSLAELIFLFSTGISRLMNKISLISRIYLWCPYFKVVNSSKDGILFKFSRWSRIALSFDGLTFLNVNGDTQYVLQT